MMQAHTSVHVLRALRLKTLKLDGHRVTQSRRPAQENSKKRVQRFHTLLDGKMIIVKASKTKMDLYTNSPP